MRHSAWARGRLGLALLPALLLLCACSSSPEKHAPPVPGRVTESVLGPALPASAAETPAPSAAPASAPAEAIVASANAANAAGAASEPPPSPPLPRPGPGRYGERADVQAFANDLAQRQPTLKIEQITQALATAQYQPAVARLIMPAATPAAKNWAAYRARFVEPKRIQAGQQFMAAQAAPLQAAEQRWGVPAPVIAAIIGVETFYGRNMGSFRLLDALATLTFDFPTGRSDRSAFFREELEALLLLSQREQRAPDSFMGSYAGAVGLPQFMPGSWLRHAVDFDGDGHIDLQTSPADAIGSVANFLANHGWQRGLPTHYAVTPPPPGPSLDRLLGPDILPSFRPDEMTALGASLSEDGLRDTGLLALVELKNGTEAPTYIAGTQNFWVITRYNRSSYYALSVIDLAQALGNSPSRSSTLGRR